MYPAWASGALGGIFLVAALVLFIGKMRRGGIALVITGVVAGVAAIAMYVVAEARYSDCSHRLSPLTDQFSYCERVVFGDPGPKSYIR